MTKIDLRNPPNEMPDIVGYKPENPLAANFKPYISAHTRIRELTPVPLIIGTLLGIIFGASSLNTACLSIRKEPPAPKCSRPRHPAKVWKISPMTKPRLAERQFSPGLE